MVGTANPTTINFTNISLPEKRVIFYNLNWERYQQILNALEERRSAKLTYDRGSLGVHLNFEENQELNAFWEWGMGNWEWQKVSCSCLSCIFTKMRCSQV